MQIDVNNHNSSEALATPVILPRKFHGWRSLAGYSPWGRKESDATEQLHFHFHTVKVTNRFKGLDPRRTMDGGS